MQGGIKLCYQLFIFLLKDLESMPTRQMQIAIIANWIRLPSPMGGSITAAFSQTAVTVILAVTVIVSPTFFSAPSTLPACHDDHNRGVECHHNEVLL